MSMGFNAFGQLGDGTNIDSNIPVSVYGISTATQVAAGYLHSLALLSDYKFVFFFNFNLILKSCQAMELS